MPQLQALKRAVIVPGQAPVIEDYEEITGTEAEAAAVQQANEATAVATATEISDLASQLATAMTWLQAIQDDATAGTTQANTDIGTATTGESVTLANLAAAQTQIRALYTLVKRTDQRQVKIIQACDRLAIIVRRMLKLVARQLASTPVVSQ